ARSSLRIRSSPVLAMKSADWLLLNASPLAPKGGKPEVARSGSCASVVTGHAGAQALGLLMRKMAPWNESDTYRLQWLSNTRPFGAGKKLDPNKMVSELPSGLPTVRAPGAPMPGRSATSSIGVVPSNAAGIRWIFEAPKLAMYTLPCANAKPS